MSDKEAFGWQLYHKGQWCNENERVSNHPRNTEEEGIPARDVFAAPIVSKSEPVATVRSVTNRKSSLFDIVIHDNQALNPGTKLFIHAGHSDEEIERLNVLIRGSRASLDTCALQIESLQAQLVESQNLLEWCVGKLRAACDFNSASILENALSSSDDTRVLQESSD